MDLTPKGIKQFILAGKSYFTIHNTDTDKRFTFKVCRLTDDEGKPANDNIWFVSVLTGSDNENSYSYMGIIRDGVFRLTKKSKMTSDATSVKAFGWLWNTISADINLPERVDFHHAGRCGRCGRKLTTPESVESGFGPKCITLLGF